MRARRVAVTMLVVGGVATGCTSTVAGLAQPEPGRVTVAPAASTDPCSLLTTDEAEQLGLVGPGVPKVAQPNIRVPAGCEWMSTNPDSSLDNSLEIFYSTDLATGEYFSSQSTGQEQLGGIDWDNYPSALGDTMCNLAVTLSQLSFVAVTSQNFTDSTKACDTARKAAPLVATRLPR